MPGEIDAGMRCGTLSGRPFVDGACSTYVLWHILGQVEHGVHGVDVREVHEGAVGQRAAGIELALPEAGLEDVEGWDLDEQSTVSQLFDVDDNAASRTQTPREISAPASASALAIAQPKPCASMA
jgi:hypothetical protein